MHKRAARFFLVAALVLLCACGTKVAEEAPLGAVTYVQAATEPEENYTMIVHWNDRTEDGIMVFLSKGGEWVAEIAVPVQQNLEGWGMVQEEFDPETRTGSFGNNHLTYLLDFNDQTWELVRHYSLEHLSPPLAYNDEWEIRAAHQSWFDSDIVALEKATGEITFLTITVADPEGFIFAPDNLLVISGLRQLLLIDVENAIMLDSAIGSRPMASGGIIQGNAYDNERDWFVILWRYLPVNYAPAPELHPVMMSVYTREGELVRSFDTGMDGFAIFAQNSLVRVRIELDGQGNATIYWGGNGSEPIGTVRYLP